MRKGISIGYSLYSIPFVTIRRMNTDNTPKQYGLKHIIVVGAVLLILAVLLLLDLQFRGLAWRFIYYQTGEESVLGQIQGMAELGGNLFRSKPQTDPYTPIQHNELFPYGINTFLEQETEEPKMREMLRLINAAGFGWVRQEFPWFDIEVDGRGQFTDSRVDRDGDGSPDTISAWIKYDLIVDLVEEYDLGLIVRLSTIGHGRLRRKATQGQKRRLMIIRISSIMRWLSLNAIRGGFAIIRFGMSRISGLNGAKILLVLPIIRACCA
jgi:hypothetical protein